MRQSFQPSRSPQRTPLSHPSRVGSWIESLRDSLVESRTDTARPHEQRRRGSWIWGLGFVMAAGALALAAPARAELLIDDFSSDQNLELSSVDESAATVGPAPAAIGGERDLQVERVSGSGGAVVNVNGGGQGQLLFIPDIGLETILRVVWDGDDADAGQIDFIGLDHADLRDGGALDAFAIELDADLETTLTLRVYDASDPAGAVWSAASVPVLPTGGAFAVIEVLFSEFTDSGLFGAADFGNVGAISLEVAGVPSLDLRLDSVRVVPEPAAASLAGLATLAWLARNRRRRGER